MGQDVVRAAEKRGTIAKRVEAAGRLIEVELLANGTVNKSRGQLHAQDVIESLERDAFPTLGKLPITCIDAPTVLQALRKVEEQPAIETAKRVRQRISAIFVYAIASGRATIIRQACSVRC